MQNGNSQDQPEPSSGAKNEKPSQSLVSIETSNPFVFIAWKTLRAPFEVFRIRYQCDIALYQAGKLPGPYTSSWNCMRTLVAREGLSTMWRGNTASLLMYVPNYLADACLSKPLDHLETKVKCDRVKHGYLRYRTSMLLMTGIRGTARKTLAYPLDSIKTRLINDVLRQEYTGIKAAGLSIVSKHGVFGLYRGFHVSVCGMLVYEIVRNLFYDGVVAILPADGGNSSRDYYVHCLSIVAGTMAAYPLDTIKRRMMMAESPEELKLGVLDWFRHIYESEGIWGFFKGASITAILTGALTLSSLALFWMISVGILKTALNSGNTEKTKKIQVLRKRKNDS